MKYLIIALCFMSNLAFADSERNTYINNEQTINVYKGAALAIAMSNHHFSHGTYELQGSIATGSFNGSEAISFGIAKRVKDLLISGSIGREGGKTGFGVGITFRF